MKELLETKNEVEIFNNEEFGQIRTIIIDGEPWFIGKDIAIALGYSDSKDAIKKHVYIEDKEVFQKGRFATLENIDKLNIPNRGMTFVNESGLYSLIFGSKLDSAKQFKRWVTSEVLPSIRKTGGYITDQSNKVEIMLEDMGCNIKVMYAQINNMENILGEQTEKLNQVVDNMTLSTRQQQRIYKAAKDRVNHLLNGAHSEEYKMNSRSYFINLWNGLKSKFKCGSSYKDLNPIYFDGAIAFIQSWNYIEN